MVLEPFSFDVPCFARGLFNLIQEGTLVLKTIHARHLIIFNENRKFLINVAPHILQEIADRSKICANYAKLHSSSRKCKLHSKWRNLPTGGITIFWRSKIQAYNFLAEMGNLPIYSIVLPKSHFEKWKVREWVRISKIQSLTFFSVICSPALLVCYSTLREGTWARVKRFPQLDP